MKEVDIDETTIQLFIKFILSLSANDRMVQYVD